MNEELQKQLIEMLRDLRINASPTFNMLVEQMQGMCLINSIFASISLLVGILLIKPFITRCETFFEDNEIPIVFFGSMAVGFTLTGIIALCINLPYLFYPLGAVLTKIL